MNLLRSKFVVRQSGFPKPTISEPGFGLKTHPYCSVLKFCRVINNPNRMMLEPGTLTRPELHS
jgi:hypothetical protein